MVLLCSGTACRAEPSTQSISRAVRLPDLTDNVDKDELITNKKIRKDTLRK